MSENIGILGTWEMIFLHDSKAHHTDRKQWLVLKWDVAFPHKHQNYPIQKYNQIIVYFTNRIIYKYIFPLSTNHLKNINNHT